MMRIIQPLMNEEQSGMRKNKEADGKRYNKRNESG